MSWLPEPVAPPGAAEAPSPAGPWTSPTGAHPAHPAAPPAPAPQAYAPAPQPYAPAPPPYAPAPGGPQPYPQQPHAQQPYAAQPHAPQPYTQQPYASQPYAAQVDPRFVPYGQTAPQVDPRFVPYGQALPQQPSGQAYAPHPYPQPSYPQPSYPQYAQPSYPQPSYPQPHAQHPYGPGGLIGLAGARPIAHHGATRSLMVVALFVMGLSALRFLGANDATPGNPYYSPTLAGAQVVSFLGALAVLALTYLGRRRADEGSGSLLRVAGGAAVALGVLSLVSLLTIMTTGRGIGVAGGMSMLAAGVQTLRVSSG